jgi:sulfatase modifying factor 1
MRSQRSWARLAIGGVTVTLCAAACADVLDIQDPKTRNEAGAAGEPADPNTAGTATGGGGTSGNNPIETGGAGQGGNDDVPGGAGAGAGAGGGGAGAGAGGGGAGGEGGTATGECTPNEARCGGDAEKTPEVCDGSGHWIANTGEADGDCSNACLDGKCTECNDADAPQCKVCADGTADCNPNQRQKCVAGVWTDDGNACEQFCVKGSCETAPSCDAAYKARTTCNGNESCCESLLIPGSTFNRYVDDDLTTPYPATVSKFLLDKFEVTVGRMRPFVYAYDQLKPMFEDGAGSSKHLVGDGGWNSNYLLPLNKDDLIAQLKCDSAATWSDTLIENNELPINCVTFNVAYAFCISEGGRLPSEAEWQSAATGGAEERAYPWSLPLVGAPITDEYANYNSPVPLAPGQKPLGDGRWGQSDLAGNLAEWVLDYYAGYPENCADCVNGASGTTRVFRGGAYLLDESSALASVRDSLDPLSARSFVGFRCARDLE